MKTDVELTNELELRALAAELRIVLGRLIRRLRAEYRFGLTQASVLGRLDREGPQYIGELAAAERVRPQSMSQALDELEAEKLIERCPDATDGRRTRIALTAQGRAALEADRAARGKEITQFTRREQDILQKAVLLLDRLANSD